MLMMAMTTSSSNSVNAWLDVQTHLVYVRRLGKGANLFHFFHHQHLDRLAARHKFEAQLVKNGLF
jgi:hypothetical protein